MLLSERLDLIKPKILEPRFLTGRGMANEINYWIFEYPSEDEMQVRSYVQYLVNNINGSQDNIRIKCFDLYVLMMEVLHEKNYLDKVKQMEKSKGSTAIINPIKKTLRLTEDEDMVIEKIAEGITSEKDVAFIVGVGKVWPIIRSHTILNNLHLRGKVEKNPLVMFFPGEYTNELKLFGEITHDNYYRALKLV